MSIKQPDGLARAQLTALRAALDRYELLLDSPDADAAALTAGKLHELCRSPELAAEAYATLLQRNPSNTEAKARLAIALLKSGDTEQALRHAQELVQHNPDFRFRTLLDSPASIMTILGDALEATGDDSGAADAYGRALGLEPQDEYSAGRLGMLIASSGDTEGLRQLEPRLGNDSAAALLRSVLRLKSNDAHFLPAIERISAHRQRVQKV
jgi:Flp pilus assembly protein TadD